ncbi:type VI secretion system tip protein VgrG [Citrobacter sp. wls757]|uniref:type VI secretion system Vgr family protein n=1 Tax=Citrobacter sp. wls757 TaxID=2576417 RepID=UPI0010C9A224|nr:type VI secretion system Vgr family protein [Citrobacter sp. wls757]TKU39573.1 type VI secretion system tip protein VgrG [Citrobacter sp. wls757]
MDKSQQTMATTLNRYFLSIPSCSSVLDVEDFNGSEGLSRNYYYDILFTSADKDIQANQFLRQVATLTMNGGKLGFMTTQKIVHGVITDFQRLSGSADEARYHITLTPYLSLLDKQFRTHRFFINKSVPEVVGEILQEHALHGWEYEFTLTQSYPKREQINQYQESDLAFIERLLAEVGIFYFFTLQPDTRTEVVHFADQQSAYEFDKRLALDSPSGMNDSGADSVWGLNILHQVAPAGVTTKDYNHREAQKVLQSARADITGGEGEEIRYGEVYHYKPRHLETGEAFSPAPETGNFWARLDHERFLAEQTLITGFSTDVGLRPGQVLTITDSSVPSTLPDVLQQPVVVVRAGFSGSRKDALKVSLAAVPYSETQCWRPALKARPKVSGTLTARVSSPKSGDIYAHQTAEGLYRVKFDADQDSKQQGYESMLLRLAKPYGGDTYGIHFPLIQGTEVAVAFHEGDPDRPYIAHALHDSRHPDHVTQANHTRNVIRTPANNKLRMEDKRGEEHVKLSTEYGGKTQLNLGHNVDAGRALRGEGAELRTDDWVAVRGGKGVFITSDRQSEASDRMLEMKNAAAQMVQALSVSDALANAADIAQAWPADSDTAKALNTALNNLTQPGIVLNAPEHISISSPKSVRLSSGSESVGLVAGGNTDISVMKKFTAVAGEAISLLALKLGIRLFAAKGKVEIQAQDDGIDTVAKKDITITSVEGKVLVTAADELVLNCGGAYIKLSGGNVEIGCPQNILLKSISVQKLMAVDYDLPKLELPKGFNDFFIAKDEDSGEIMPFVPYRIKTGEGNVYEGVTDAEGKTITVYTAQPESLDIELL